MILKEQLSEIEAQQRALRDILTTSVLLENSWWGKGPMAAPETFETRVAETEARIKRMLDMADRSGGGRGGREFYEPTRIAKEDRTIYGWNVEDLTEAAGRIQFLFEQIAESTRPKDMTAPWGGGTLFGTMTEKELVRAEDRLNEYQRAAQDALNRFGPEYTDTLFGEGWAQRLAEESAYLQQMREHFDELQGVGAILHDVADGFKAFGGALREDMFGAGVIDQINQFATNMDKFTEALENNKSAYDLTLASIPIMRQFTNAFIKDRRAQAGIEAAMQAAAAFAAWAIPNPAKALAHTAAAMLYAGVAGGAIKLPSGKPRDTTPKEGRGSSGGEVRRPDIHIYLQGTLVQTEAERGVLAQHAIAEARRRGML